MPLFPRRHPKTPCAAGQSAHPSIQLFHTHTTDGWARVPLEGGRRRHSKFQRTTDSGSGGDFLPPPRLLFGIVPTALLAPGASANARGLYADEFPDPRAPTRLSLIAAGKTAARPWEFLPEIGPIGLGAAEETSRDGRLGESLAGRRRGNLPPTPRQGQRR